MSTHSGEKFLPTFLFDHKGAVTLTFDLLTSKSNQFLCPQLHQSWKFGEIPICGFKISCSQSAFLTFFGLIVTLTSDL